MILMMKTTQDRWTQQPDYSCLFPNISACPPTCCSSHLDDVMAAPARAPSRPSPVSGKTPLPPPPPPLRPWVTSDARRAAPERVIPPRRRGSEAAGSALPPIGPGRCQSRGPSRRTPSASSGSPSAESPSYWLLEAAATAAEKEPLTMVESAGSPRFNRDLFLKAASEGV